MIVSFDCAKNKFYISINSYSSEYSVLYLQEKYDYITTITNKIKHKNKKYLFMTCNITYIVYFENFTQAVKFNYNFIKYKCDIDKHNFNKTYFGTQNNCKLFKNEDFLIMLNDDDYDFFDNNQYLNLFSVTHYCCNESNLYFDTKKNKIIKLNKHTSKHDYKNNYYFLQIYDKKDFNEFKSKYGSLLPPIS